MKRTFKLVLITILLVVGSSMTTQAAASADPAPGFTFDPVKLEADMQACIAYSVPETQVLMGWINVRSGETRTWRCSSLRHMLFDDDLRDPPVAHDPFVNPLDFMKCADKAVAGFPRSGTGPGNTSYIYQYEGTAKRALVIVNDATGDIASIYTEPSNDWTACALGL